MPCSSPQTPQLTGCLLSMQKHGEWRGIWKHLQPLMNFAVPHPPLSSTPARQLPSLPSPPPSFTVAYLSRLPKKCSSPPLRHATLSSLSATRTQDTSPTTLHGPHSKIQDTRPGPQPPRQPWPLGHTHRVSSCLYQSLSLGSQHRGQGTRASAPFWTGRKR